MEGKIMDKFKEEDITSEIDCDSEEYLEIENLIKLLKGRTKEQKKLIHEFIEDIETEEKVALYRLELAAERKGKNVTSITRYGRSKKKKG